MEIDVYKGNENVFLILTGVGGSTKGYKNKYVTIAENINKKYGFTVFVITTESGIWNNEKEYFDNVMKKISSYAKMLKLEIKKIYAMGTSAGANLLIHNSHRFILIEKILPINVLFNVNYNLFCDFVKDYKGYATIIVGEKDSSNNFVNMIKKFENKNIKVITVQNADHNFTNMLEEYINLPEKFLFN